jgi:hypothetical protein
MPIATGIEGIRKILATNAKGWHVVNATTDKYVVFYDETLSDLRKTLATDYPTYRIVEFTGNGVIIAEQA